MRDEEYFRFRVEKDDRDWFKTAVKGLVLATLVIAVVLLSIWGYRYITKDSIETKRYIATPTTTPAKQNITLKKEELAAIVKLVLKEIQKNQKTTINIQNKSEDSELLKSLQNTPIDTIANKPIKKKDIYHDKKKIEKLANKKIKDQIIKKKITYNAVVINQKEIKSINDLAKLYASINKISRKKKKKILRSAYTKKITKEIIIRKNAMRTIKVRAGDTLSSIAQRAYGKSSMYHKIFEANPDLLSDPNRLRVGMILRVPK